MAPSPEVDIFGIDSFGLPPESIRRNSVPKNDAVRTGRSMRAEALDSRLVLCIHAHTLPSPDSRPHPSRVRHAPISSSARTGHHYPTNAGRVRGHRPCANHQSELRTDQIAGIQVHRARSRLSALDRSACGGNCVVIRIRAGCAPAGRVTSWRPPWNKHSRWWVASLPRHNHHLGDTRRLGLPPCRIVLWQRGHHG